MIRVGFIGTGWMGRYQAQAFAKVSGCAVVAGADIADEALKKFAAEHPKAALYTDYRKLLANPHVDAVVIAVPTGLHKKIAEAALRAKIPTLLEKPMARTVAECHSLIETERRTRTLLMIAHCRRYDPHWGSWGRLVTSGKLGAPILWRHLMAGIGPGRWFMDDKLGGGPLMDGAVHNYDFANMLFGDPVSVLASAAKMDHGVTAIDTASAIVRYKSGNQLLVSWSWAVRGCSLHDIIGPKGFIQFGTGDHKVPEADKKKYSYCCFTAAKGKQTLIRSQHTEQMYVVQARHFLDCIRGKAKCQTPGTESIKAVAVAEAILKAAAKGGEKAVRW
ncbi:MAG: Gfo/Idh/MocA family oxidoreductase [Planctomycetota bacterium]|nr:Gfo/Idh/MocA family oxidoreductase [Planctomycetota bacterium]